MSHELLFTLVVGAALLAVLYDYYLKPLLAVAMFILLWKVVEVIGPSLLLAALLITVAAIIHVVLRLGENAPEPDDNQPSFFIRLLDALLTSRDRGPDRDGRERRIWTDQDDTPDRRRL